MDNETAIGRDQDFERISSELLNIFAEKNRKYDDAFFSVNDRIEDAFLDIEHRVELLRIALKYHEKTFNQEEFVKNLKHLAIYSIMMVMLLEYQKNVELTSEITQDKAEYTEP